VSAQVGRFSVEAEGSAEIVTVLLPTSSGDAFRECRAFEPRGGIDIEVRTANFLDRLEFSLVSPQSAAASPARPECLWTRRPKAGGAPIEVIAVGALSGDIEGAFGFTADRPIDWLTAKLSAGALEVWLERGSTISLVPHARVQRVCVNGRPVQLDPARPTIRGDD
jgi:hypothetical protein